MIEKQYIQNLVEQKLQGTGYELITLKISAQKQPLSENLLLAENSKNSTVSLDKNLLQLTALS